MDIVGIDLGTTFSAIGVVEAGKPRILPVAGQNIMPSVVGASPEGEWLVGQNALNQWVLYPERTVRSIKRKMGTNETFALGGKSYSPQQISALILQRLRVAAKENLGYEVVQAVITVPAYFSDAQRQATREAGEIAGLEVVRIINEPTAAALAYGLESERDEIALIYDLGGGTFDASLVELSTGVVDVRASHGNTQLGGDDFDERFADWLREKFEDRHKVDLRGDQQALARLRRAAEEAKITLSTESYTWVREEYLAQKRGTPLHLEIEVSRLQFFRLIEDLLVSTLDSVDRVLEDGEVERPEHVLLVGGSTHIPAVWEMLSEHLDIMPRQDVDPSEAVALGAGIQGAIIAGAPIDAILVDVTPYSLGIAVANFTLLGDLVPDRFKKLIPRNSTIPTTQEEVFQTLYPDQDIVKIEVYQGEHPVASENILLGEFLFENLKPENPGELASFTVQFDIDVDGMLIVQAVDRGSGQEAGITVKAERKRLSQAEIQSAQDELPKDVRFVHHLPAPLVQEAEALLIRAEYLLAEADDPELRSITEQARSTWSAGNEDELRAALEELTDRLFDLEE